MTWKKLNNFYTGSNTLKNNELIDIFAPPLSAQVTLSAGLSTFTHVINLFAIPQIIKKNLCAALVNSVIDCKLQNWEEMTAPAFDVLNCTGPLRKNKQSTLDDISVIDRSSFEFERFKRHVTGVLERLCRLTSSENRIGTVDTDGDALEEEEDDDTAIAAAEDTESPSNKTEEESDWICDVKQTMDLLPRL